VTHFLLSISVKKYRDEYKPPDGNIVIASEKLAYSPRGQITYTDTRMATTERERRVGRKWRNQLAFRRVSQKNRKDENPKGMGWKPRLSFSSALA